MILTTRRQHRILSAMYSSLRRSDPRLVATFMMFTRLTSDEAIPPFERIKTGPLRWPVNAIRHAVRSARRAINRPGRGVRWAVGCLLFVPAAAAAMFALAVVISQGRGPLGCVTAHPAAGQVSRSAAAMTKQNAAASACPNDLMQMWARGR